MRRDRPPADAPASRPLSAWTAVVTATGQVAARTSTLVFTAVATAVVTRAIGADEFADWGTVLLLFAMVGFALDPGLAPVVVRRLAQSPDDAPSPSALLAVRVVAAFAAYAFVVAVSVALRGDDVLVLALVMAAQLIPRAVVLNVGTWMQAEHRLHIQTTLEAITAAGGLALLVAGAALGASAPVLAALGFLLPALVLAVLMQRQLGRLPHATGHGRERDRDLVRSVLWEAAPLAGAIVLVSVYTRIGIVFVNRAHDGDVAEFALAFLFIEQVLVVAAIVAATLLPLMAARTQVARARSDDVVHDLFVAMSTVGALGALFLIGLSKPLVLLLGGPDLEGAAPILRLLAPVCVALFANVFVAYLFVAIRRSARYMAYNLVGLAISVALGFALTLNYGAEGAARATWITESAVVAIAAVPYFSRDPGGRRALLLAGAAAALVIAASEVTASGAVPALLAAVVAATLVLAGTARRARGWIRRVQSARVARSQV